MLKKAGKAGNSASKMQENDVDIKEDAPVYNYEFCMVVIDDHKVEEERWGPPVWYMKFCTYREAKKTTDFVSYDEQKKNLF